MAKMTKREGDRIVARIIEIAAQNGGKTRVRNDSQTKHVDIVVEVDMGDLRCSIDIDDLLGGGLCGHWYDAGRPVAELPFTSINNFHRRKATLYLPTADEFLHAFEGACLAIKTGWAFDDNWKPAQRAT